MKRAFIVAAVLCVAGLSACAADFVWMEGEKPSSANFPVKSAGWGNKQYLSEEAWLHLAVDKDIEKTIPPGGVLIAYQFEAPKAGRYEVWNRIGFEHVRAPFSWRIDNGAWTDVPPTQLTTDLMEIAFWCEVAWVKMGEAELAPGRHTLEIRVGVPYRQEGDKKVPQRVLYASDAICLYAGQFRPNGRLKPGQVDEEEIDRQAAAQVFEVNKAEPSARSETPLGGIWQIARFDEMEIEDRTGPIKALPAAGDLFWKGIRVPGDRDALRPEWSFCHRYLYRTRVRVPAELAGRSFFLRFPSVNMIATVFANGVPCGWTKAPFALWECDITKAVRPGGLNEIVVGIKDTYYAPARDTRRMFNMPRDLMLRNQGVSMQMDFPVWNHLQNGILETPVLIAAGTIYTADVFVKPSVKNKTLSLEITLRNPAGGARQVEVAHEVVPLGGGPAGLKIPAEKVSLAGDEHVLKREGIRWENPRLWWPDDPQQYEVITTVSSGGKVLDTQRTKFGFREWSWEGRQFKLNGVPWQGRADLTHHHTNNPRQAIETWRRNGQTMFRFWGTRWGGMGMKETLDFMDASGMPVRRSGIFDGEMASYGLTEQVEENGKKVRRARKALFDNWQHQLLAQVRGERNHPSIFIWSIENEIVYINSLNLGQWQWVEPAVAAVAAEVMKTDPTRPVMVDGGQALTDMSLPVVGAHYVESDQRDYPDQAYTLEKLYAGKSRNQWPTPQDRPMLMGESFFARGHNPPWFAGIGGESAFLGRSETVRPCGLFARMLSEGYRWHGVAGFHFWFGEGDATLHYNSWQPVAVLCRQWNWTFAGGSTVKRTLKVLNDTRHADPVDVSWQMEVDGKPTGGERRTCRIAPGGSEVVEISLTLPAVSRRTAGRFILTAERAGKEVFRDVREVWVIDRDGAAKPAIRPGELIVVDPHGSARARLAARGVSFTEVAGPEKIPDGARLVIVGKDALSARWATDPRWVSLAAAGARVLVLEQKTPLHYQAAPADFEPTEHVGRIAFAENLEHPVFEGLNQCDFFTWSGDHVVYRNVYRKASSGARSLAQCDLELSCSAIAECPVNDGLLLLCQMVVGEKLDSDPVAARLFDNMVNYIAGYAPVRRNTAVALDAASPLARMLTESGLKFDMAADVLGAIGSGRYQIIIAEATPANLRALAGAADAVKAFAEAGGWLMLFGLTPEGLADFNRLVGVEHLLRPFELERVTLPAVRDPLTAGLTARDVVMESGQKIFAWAGDKFLADDVFTWVVDIDDIAPFCEIPGPAYWNDPDAKPGNDRWPRNMFNGFVNADSWRYCFSIHLADNDPTKWTMKLPREEEITGFSVALNTIYHKVTRINLYFDNDPKPLTLETRPVPDRQDFAIGPRRAKTLTVELAEWEKSGKADVVGVDNMWLRVRRTEDFMRKVRPLLNIGAIVKYPAGKGGIVLNQLRISATEAVPVNAQKKRNIVSTILRNMGAVYAGGKTLSLANLKYEPLPLEDMCNAYITRDRGWFDDKRDLSHMPVGEVKLAGVTYVIRDFRTSPVPSCIMLAGPQARGPKLPRQLAGLKVEKKADVLFFLHAFNQARQWEPRRRDDQPPAVFEYVIHYADGQQAEVPVMLGRGVAHWVSTEPSGLKDAALAWTARFPGDDSGDMAAVYQMQWNNPRPAVEIKSIDIRYDQRVGNQWGTPAVLAITAGRTP